MKITVKILFPFLYVAGGAAVLYLISFLVADETVFPSPTEVAAEFTGLLTSSLFYREILLNLLRTVASFAAAFALASLCAAASSLSGAFRRIFAPVVVSLRAVPTMSVLLWALIIFRSEISPMAVSFVVIFPMLYSAVLSAAENRDKELDDMARVFGLGRLKTFTKIILPDIAERLFPQFCSLLSFNVKLMVAGEALAYTRLSLGKELYFAKINFEMAKLFAITVAVILLSVLVEAALKGGVMLVKRLLYGYNRRKIIEKIR